MRLAATLTFAILFAPFATAGGPLSMSPLFNDMGTPGFDADDDCVSGVVPSPALGLLALGGNFSGTLNPIDDRNDTFAYAVAVGDDVTVELDPAAWLEAVGGGVALYEIDLRVLNSTCAVIGTSANDGATPESVTFTVSQLWANTTYFNAQAFIRQGDVFVAPIPLGSGNPDPAAESVLLGPQPRLCHPVCNPGGYHGNATENP